jgi:formaldehyde-activating enzyme involved in methanogenesis
VTIKGAKQAVQMFGPSNYHSTKEALARAVKGEATAAEVVAKRNEVKHPFAA